MPLTPTRDKPMADATPAPPRKRATAKRTNGAATSTRHDDKRTAILRTAAQLFAERGYEATSLDTIADQLGMHKATLYHYVQGKESILYECLVNSFGDLDEVIERTKDRSVPVLQRLRDFVRSLAAAQNNDFGRCLVMVGSRPLELTPDNKIRQFQRRLDLTVRSLITEGIADGSLRPCDPSLFAALLFGALNWVPRWHKDSGKLSVQQVVDSFMDMLTTGIVARRA
jgi:AcrR family transcriptional regulator